MDSTIISAIIGALATILGALISRGYAERQVVTTQPTKPLNTIAASILLLLSKLPVNSAQVIQLKKDQVYISDSLGIVLAAEMLLSSLAHVKLTVLGAEAQSITLHRGDVLCYQSPSGLCYLICTKVSYSTVEIQVRNAIRDMDGGQ